MARRRATIRELARHTGLSPAAVSYALRGLQVSSATEARVRAAAAELGYEADPIARALRGGQTGVVGLLSGSLEDLYHQRLVHALQRELRRVGRHAIVADADGEPAREIELAGRLLDQRVDGLIIAPIGPGTRGWRGVAGAVPVVSVGDALRGAHPAAEVLFDTARGAAAVLRHLHAAGHRRVAVLSWAVETAPDRGAEASVARWAERLGLACDVVPCAYSLNGSQPLAREILEAADRPTAVFCLSDSIAYGVYSACRALGLRIPDDVAVCGFDDHPVSRLLDPPLTSVDWDVERVAALAVAELVEALEGDGTAGPPGTRRTVVPPVLRERASTAAG